MIFRWRADLLVVNPQYYIIFDKAKFYKVIKSEDDTSVEEIKFIRDASFDGVLEELNEIKFVRELHRDPRTQELQSAILVLQNNNVVHLSLVN